MPVDVRSVSIAILDALAIVFALKSAAPVIVPLTMGLMFSYALSPLMDRVQRWQLPRAVAPAS